MGHRRQQDHYGRKAKSDGYAARSVYKLEEIQKRFQVIPKNGAVLDLGCSPASWSSYVKRVGGADTTMVGIDLTEVSGYLGRQFIDSVFDVPEEDLREALGGGADLVISDMAPATSGNRFTDHVRQIEPGRAGEGVGLTLASPRRKLRSQGLRRRGRLGFGRTHPRRLRQDQAGQAEGGSERRRRVLCGRPGATRRLAGNPARERRDHRAGTTGCHVLEALVQERRARDVEVSPCGVRDELAEEERSSDAAGGAATDVLDVAPLGLEHRLVVVGEGHVPDTLACIQRCC